MAYAGKIALNTKRMARVNIFNNTLMDRIMKRYWIGIGKTMAVFLWSFFITWLVNRIGKPYSNEMFLFSILIIMVFILSVSYYSDNKED